MTHLLAIETKLPVTVRGRTAAAAVALIRAAALIVSVLLIVLFLSFFTLLTALLAALLVALLFHRFLHLCEVTGTSHKPTGPIDRSKNKKQFFCYIESMA